MRRRPDLFVPFLDFSFIMISVFVALLAIGYFGIIELQKPEAVMRKELSRQEEEINRLQKELSEIVDEHNRRILEKENISHKYETENISLMGQLKEKEAQIKEKEKIIKKLEEKIGKLQAEVTELKKKIGGKHEFTDIRQK